MANLQGKLSDINMVIFNGQECKLVHFDDACTWADKYSLTIPQLPVGVGSCEVTRISSQATLATKGKIAVGSATSETKVDIYYSDVLSATATEGHGFNAPTVTLSETNVTNNVTANITRGSAKATTLSWSAKPTGVASFDVVALRSPYNGWVSESDPVNLSADGKAGSQTVYFGDEFAIEAEADTGYGTPKLNVSSSFTVDTTPISITVEAGATKEYQMTIPAFGPTISSVTVKKNGTTIATGKQYEIVYFKANHFDTLTLEVVSAEGYDNASYKSSWYITGPTSFEWSEPNVKQYTLKKVTSGNGIKDYVVTRTQSPLGLATTGELSDGATLFYGDVLTQSANPVTGYYTPGFNWTNKTITVNDSTANSNKEITSTVTGGGVIKSKLTINALPTGVASLKVERTYSQLQGAGRGELTNGADIYYGDTLKGTATASTGYNDPTVNIGSAYSVTDKNVTVEATAGSLKTYTLSLVGYNATISVTKNSRPLNNGDTITHFDKLIVSATAEAGYRITSITAGGNTISSGSEVTVTGNLTVTVNTEAIPYTLSYPAQPTGGTFTILKSAGDGSGNMTPITLNTSGGSFTVYKNEIYVVETSAADVRYWNAPTTNWSGNEITIGTDNVTLTVTHQPKAFTLTMPVCPSPGVSSYTITRSGTYKTADWTTAGGNSSVQTKTVYYGDKLSISAVAQDGFANPTATIASSVTGNLSASVTRGLKMATLTISKCNQANTHTVKRNGTAIASGTTVYEGDVLSYEVTAKTGYYTPTHKWHNGSTSYTTSTYTVTMSDSTIASTSFDAGTIKYTLTISAPNASVTVKRGDTTLSNGATIYHFDTLTITASANTGYEITGIYAAGSAISSGSSITVSDDTTVSVTTKAKGCVLAWPAKPAGAKFTLLKAVTSTSQEIIVQNPSSAGSIVLPYGTHVFVDYSAENSTYWNAPTVNWTEKELTDFNVTTNFIIYHSPKSYTLSYPKTLTGVTGFKIDRTFTHNVYTATGNLVTNPSAAGTVTVYYGDTLTATASASNAAYHTPSLSWTSLTVDGNESISFTGNSGVVRSYTLTINKASQAASHTVTRTSSQYAGAGSTITNGVIYYGDVLSASVTESAPYNKPSLDWTSTTVYGNVTSTSTNKGVKQYTLTISKATQAASHTVTRTSSQYAGAGSTITNGVIYYGDVLAASVTASEGYNTPSLDWTSKTVYSSVTSTSTNTGVKTYSITKSSPNATVTVRDANGNAVSSVTHFQTYTITATVDPLWAIESMTVNGSAFTNGGSHTVSGASYSGLNIVVRCKEVAAPLSYPYPAPTGTSFQILQYNGTNGWQTLTLESDGSMLIPIGTQLMFNFSANGSGYNTPTAKLNNVTISSEHVATMTADGLGLSLTANPKPYTLSYPATPTGVSSYSIKRNGSTIVSSPSYASTVTVYYGDYLTISASASSYYGTPTYKFSNGSTSITVTGNVSATVTAGSYSPPQPTTISFGLDTPYAVYTCPANTKWSTLDAQSVLGYMLYNDGSDLVTPVQNGGYGPWVIDPTTNEAVDWNDYIKDGVIYYMGGG